MQGQVRRVGDPELVVTDDQHCLRTEAVKAGGAAPECWGVKDSCIISDMLPYMRPRRVFFVPIIHALYRGLVRDLFLQLLQTSADLQKQASGQEDNPTAPLPPRVLHSSLIFSRDERREIAQRGRHLTSTSDYGRVYKVSWLAYT
jgi:hypothetical protein